MRLSLLRGEMILHTRARMYDKARARISRFHYGFDGYGSALANSYCPIPEFLELLGSASRR